MTIYQREIEKLKECKGVNPRPDDFDEFWENALAEMRRVDARAELRPSGFCTSLADCFDLYFTGVRGARIHALYLRPKKSDAPHPAVVQFHGYGGEAGDWNDKLNYVALGYSVAAMDCRGQCGFSQDAGRTDANSFYGHFIRGVNEGPDQMLFRDIYLDGVQLASILMGMPEVAPDRIGLIGTSQGAGMALACASLEPGIRRVAAMSPFLSDFMKVYEMGCSSSAYSELNRLFSRYDFTHEKEERYFLNLGYIDIQHHVRNIKAHVLMGSGLRDTLVPIQAQYSAYNNIDSPKEAIVYADHAHEVFPGFYDKIFMFMEKL